MDILTDLVLQKIEEQNLKIVNALGFKDVQQFQKEIKTKNDLKAYCLSEFGGFPILNYRPDGFSLIIENYFDKSLTVLVHEIYA